MGSDVVSGIVKGWGKILTGRTPNLSIEITRECPLRCPGCYAYGDDHLGGNLTLRQVSDYKGDELVTAFMRLIDEHDPIHLSIVGGEPLVRYRELGVILPLLAERGIYTQLVTSAVRPIPAEWAVDPASAGRRLDRWSAARARRAAQARDLRAHPAAHQRPAHHRALHRDAPAGAARGLSRGVHRFLVAQRGRRSVLDQPLHAADRRIVARDSAAGQIAPRWSGICCGSARGIPKLKMPKGLIAVYAEPPSSPSECVFALTTTCVSADLERRITPCQFGGNPDCSQCGCMASAGLKAVARHKISGGIPVGPIYWSSHRIGTWIRAFREGGSAGIVPEGATGPGA